MPVEVREEGSAEGDHEHLQAATHAQQRYAGRRGGVHQSDLVVVPRPLDVQRRRALAAVAGRVHVAAAGENERVDQVEQVDGPAGREDQRPPARGGDPVGVRAGGAADVELDLQQRDDVPVSDDPDDRALAHGHRWRRLR